MRAKLIGVCPASELHTRRRLFKALEEADGARFVPLESGESIDGLVLFGPAQEPVRAGLPLLVVGADEADNDCPEELTAITRLPHVDRCLRGRTLGERRLGGGRIEVRDGLAPLALAGGRPVWAATPEERPEVHVAAMAPLELHEDESLRDRLAPGRWLALLPLVHFIQQVAGDDERSARPLRAAFLIDDPNLHWRSYGFLRYPELAADAAEHRYHVALAMVPFDAWFAHPATARLFHEPGSRLSLMMHGNNHVAGELGHAQSDEARALLAQALRRVARFERRSGVRVARVMAAPHGVCSEDAVAALLDLGFEGLCISRPYPWLARAPGPWLRAPAEAQQVAGWAPVDLVAGGLPMLLRTIMAPKEEDLVFRAYLRQPLILCGHHEEFADGLDPFRRAAELINSLGDVCWGSPGEMARQSFAADREGNVLRLRLWSRHVVVTVPRGVKELAVERPAGHAAPPFERILLDGVEVGLLTPGKGPVPIPLRAVAAGRRVRLALRTPRAVDPERVPDPKWRPWPLVRRIAAEGRDRLRPMLT